MKKVVGLNCFWIPILFFALIPQAFSQTPDIEALKKTAPKVYIDCSSCDIDYIKTEITFVNYVRDRNEAEVHVLITTQGTGSGGREYTLTFSGQNAFKGVDDIEKYFSDSTNTADEVRQGLVKALKMGLMGYVARRPIASQIAVSYTEPKKPETRVDKWKSWVFSLSGQGFFSGEQSYNRNYFDFNVSANRVTPDVKLRLGLSADFGKQHYEYEDQTYSNIQESYYFSGLFVKAFGEHWSAGFSLDAEIIDIRER